MKITCSMAEDLLPLYVEDSCSADSRKALEAHIKDCPNCRDVYTRMTAPEIPAEEAAPLVDCGKKIKRRRIPQRILTVFLSLVFLFVLALSVLAVQDMHRRANPIVHEVEAGTWNLTAGPLETTAAEVRGYVLYTNNEAIAVTVNAPGTIMLCENTENVINVAQIKHLDEGKAGVTFQNLTASKRYTVICEGMDGSTSIAVTDGRVVNFWYSLASVFYELFFLR